MSESNATATFTRMRERIADLDAENKRLQGIAKRQATILRGLWEWAETLPEQARDVEREAADGSDT